MSQQIYELSVHHDYDAPAEAAFDAFLALYDDPAQEWISGSHLDLRAGGVWDVAFKPPGVPAFHEHRLIGAVDRPSTLEYSAVIIADRPDYTTDVRIAIRPHEDGCRLTLRQSGFPSEDLRDVFAGAWPGVLELVEGELP